MAFGNDLMQIPTAQGAMTDALQQRFAVPGVMPVAAAGNVIAPVATPDILDPAQYDEQMAETMAAARKAPPNIGMIAQALASAIPGSPSAGAAPGGTGGSFGSAPQFQMQVNPFQQPPATGTSNPNLGNLLKGITA